MVENWYVKSDPQSPAYGPYSREQLHNLLGVGKLTLNILVSQDKVQWLRLGEMISDDISTRHRVSDASLPPTQRMIPQQGAKQFGHYRIIEEIGRGGMGVVYKALDEKLQRVVALKHILLGEMEDQTALKRFLQEAEISAQLRHPNIVALWESEERPVPYLAMEYIQG